MPSFTNDLKGIDRYSTVI